MKKTLFGALMCVLAAGCGGSDPGKTTGGARKPGPNNGGQATPTVVDNSVETTSKPPNLTAPGVDDENMAPFQRDLLEILRNEMDGNFAKALILCRTAAGQYKQPDETKALRTLMKRLNDEKQAATGLDFAIRNLASPDSAVVEAARRSLREAGNAGLIMARKVLREETDAELVDQTTLFLLSENDERSLRLIVHRLRDNPRSPHAVLIATELRKSLHKMEDSDFQAFYELVKKDVSFRYRGFVYILAEVIRDKCGSDGERFGALVGDTNAFTNVESYVRQANMSEDRKLQTWAMTFSDIFDLHQPGIRGAYYEGINFEKLVLERQDTCIQVPERSFPYPDNRQDQISVRWTGLIRITTPGTYTFYSASDDGQRLWVADKLLVNDWNSHGVLEQSGTIDLEPGIYPFKVEFFQGGGGAAITVSWSGPGFEKKLLTDEALLTTPWAPEN